MLIVGVTLALAWGAFAFGAVYPWAYWPLFVAAGSIGVAGLVSGRRRHEPGWRLACAAGLIVAAVGLQIVPVSRNLLSAISPRAGALIGQLDIAYASGLSARHPLSIDPDATRLALVALIALVTFAAGLSRALSEKRARVLVNGIVVIGAVMSLVGIIQRSTGTYRIYGFWSPYGHPYQIFGPFVNKNHFAGWTVMALAVAVGAFCGRVMTAMQGVRGDWRSRMLWWSSAEASQLLLMAGAIVIMAFAIVLTRSRSGLICLGVIVLLAVIALLIEARAAVRPVRGIGTAFVIALLASLAIAWAGAGPVLARLRTEAALGGRLDAWRAAVRIASDFPAAGTGVNTFATAMLFYQPPQLTEQWDAAHNDYLQLAGEGGWLVGLPIVVAMAIWLWEALSRIRTPQTTQIFWTRVGALIGVVAIAVQEAADFSLQLPGISLLFAVLIAFTLFDPRP